LDEPALLAPEFEHKKVLPALRDLYDEIWVYGLPQIYDPLADIGLPEAVMRKMIYTGYLRRSLPDAAPPRADEPGILVTAGGGGDGEVLMEWVLSAYETDPGIPHPALLVFGPFMPGEAREAFQARAEALDKVTAIDFDAQIEQLIDRSIGVVAMGGYNTFCEILSFDKPSLIVPRTQPRKEQLIRARRAQELGLARLLGDDGTRDPKRMAVALRQLPQQERPSKVILPGLLDGLPNINRLVERELEDRSGRELSLVERKG
ncbi:MAG: glycosyltransferase, partial [Rhodospirillales bacterium]|jgi:predicted glycosyltransferase|nr:glycosyltransferase [Rhodospirillales bacterium]